MRNWLAASSLVALCAFGGAAQEAQPVYQQPSSSGNLRFRVDGLVRQEWTRDVFVSDIETENQQRWRVQARPRVEFGGQTFALGVGADINYSSDDNTSPKPALERDNYESRDIRLDLAFVHAEPLKWLRLDAGRFVMPVGLTEMIWDRDLRPQGVAVTVQSKDPSGLPHYGLTGLWSRGSSPFDDNKVDMYLGSGQVTFGSLDSNFQVVGSYVEWLNIDSMEQMIHRQNTLFTTGDFAYAYRVVDFVARLHSGGKSSPFDLVADMSWNTAVSQNRRGLWLSATLGNLKTSRLRAEYTFAVIDRNATLAAYNTDDFFWETGWKGHRLDLGTQTSDKTSLHAIGELMEFKDSPDPLQQNHYDQRLRLEVRVHY